AKLELVLALWPGDFGDIGPIFMIDVLLPYMDCCCSCPIFKMVGRLTVAAAVYHVMLTYAFAYADGRRKLRRSGDEYGPTMKKDERWPIVLLYYGELISIKISDGINGFLLTLVY
ncbi:hypothetical protein Tco_0561945, partial [Tanacetum coccineum]